MAKRALLILDACVLIDFWDADPSVLGLGAPARGGGSEHADREAPRTCGDIRSMGGSSALHCDDYGAPVQRDS
ncbi:MAG TPA: hypothetical protein PKA88_11725 [Polyangiaceae bacterium]|nr:hypothetical protein [Polyangiaceae bacterium]